MDGKIVIGVDLDEQEFDKKYSELLRKQEKEQLTLDVKVKDFEETQEKLELLKQEYEQFLAEREKAADEIDGLPVSDDVVDDLVTKQWEDYEIKIDNLTAKLEKQRDALNRQKEAYEQISQKVGDYAASLEKVDEVQTKMPRNLSDIGKGLKGIVKNAGKWVLAIFSVRTAYMLIRRAVNTIAQDDEELAAKIQYIGYVVAYTLKPVVEWIVNAVLKLLSIIGAVLKGLFGISLNTKDAAKAFSKANKNANDLKKTIAGFDEMNILNDASSGGTAGTGGVGVPELPDSSNFEEYASDFKDMWDEMLNANRIATAELFADTDKTWGLLKFGWFDTIQGLVYIIQGAMDFIRGILQIIVGLFKGDIDMVKEGVSNLLKGIWEGIRGLWQFITGIAEMVLGVIWGVIKSIWDWIYNKLIQPVIDKIKLGWAVAKAIFDSIVKFVKGAINSIGNFFKGLWEGMKSGFNSAVTFIKNIFNSVVNFFKNIISTIVGLFKNIGTKVGDVVGGAFKAVVNGVLSAIENILNFPIRTINRLADKINAIPGINLGYLSTFNLPRLAKGGIVNNPGPGVMMGSYVAGEKGAEAVLPLTDDTLQRLANMIPITVNLSNNMNGRVISREIIKTQNESNFAFNR